MIIDDVKEEKENLKNQLAAHETLVENLVQINLEQEKLLREQWQVKLTLFKNK